MQTIQIKNEQRQGGSKLFIKDVLTSSPDVEARPENGKKLPLTLKPGESVKIRLIATPCNLGRFDAVIYVLLSDKVFVSSLKAHVYPNKFGLEAVYLDDVSY